MKLVLAILRRELVALPRRRRFYLERCALVGIGGAMILCGLGIATDAGSTTVGLTIFMPLSMAVLIVLSVTAAAASSSLVMREKQERTLGLLFLSDISGWSFLLGKLCTALFSTFMAILSVLPMFILAISLGGVSAGQILMALAVVLSTVLLVACLGLLVAALARTENTMNGLLVLSYLTVFVFVPVAVVLRCAQFSAVEPSTALLCAISPFAAMGGIIGGRTLGPAALNCGLSVAMVFPLLWFTQAILPGRVFSKEKPPVFQRLRERMKSARRLKHWLTPVPIRGNPVAWRDLHYWHGGARATWMKWSISTALVGVMGLLACLRILGSDSAGILISVAVLMLVFSAGVFAFGCLSHCGMAFSREKTARTLEVLVTTDLSDREIVAGKLMAVVGSVLPWLVGALVSVVVLIFIPGHDRDFWWVASAVGSEYACMWFGYCCLALWISLRFKKSVAFATCLALFILWNTLVRVFVGYILFQMCGMEIEGVVVMVLVDVVVHATVGAICLGQVLSSFRRLALLSVASADG